MHAAAPMTMPPQPEPQRYPSARATHAEVCDSPALFHETLRELYDALDIRVAKVMKLGGQELNLHLLYQRARPPPCSLCYPRHPRPPPTCISHSVSSTGWTSEHQQSMRVRIMHARFASMPIMHMMHSSVLYWQLHPLRASRGGLPVRRVPLRRTAGGCRSGIDSDIAP